jgi:hypothetical protein
VLRRLVVVSLAGALMICAAPVRALAASDDWRPLDGHYQCVWHCRERAGLFRNEPRPAAPSRPARSSPGKAVARGIDRETPRYGFGFSSWLSSLFGDRHWRTSGPSYPVGRYDSGWYGDNWGYRYDQPRWDDRWDGRWDHRYWHPGWYGRPDDRDHWSWDDGRDSGYTAHRHHPRDGDF